MNKFNEPKQVSISYTFASYDVQVVGVNLKENAHFYIKFYDEEGMEKFSKHFMLMGEDYKKWGSDDEYINQYIIDNFDKIISM